MDIFIPEWLFWLVGIPLGVAVLGLAYLGWLFLSCWSGK